MEDRKYVKHIFYLPLSIFLSLSLTLLMFWIFFADNVNSTASFNDFTIIANFFDRWPDLHFRCWVLGVGFLDV